MHSVTVKFRFLPATPSLVDRYVVGNALKNYILLYTGSMNWALIVRVTWWFSKTHSCSLKILWPIYLLCLIFSCGGLGVAVGDGDWNCQETRLLWDIPLSDIQWRSLSCSAAISLSSCTSPGGSREYLAASLATSSRHSTTFRGWPCKTVKRWTTLCTHCTYKMTKCAILCISLRFIYYLYVIMPSVPDFLFKSMLFPTCDKIVFFSQSGLPPRSITLLHRLYNCIVCFVRR